VTADRPTPDVRAGDLGPIEKPYTYLPVYADVAYVDGKLNVARGILSRATDPDLRRRWLQTVDILLAQRSALADVSAAERS